MALIYIIQYQLYKYPVAPHLPILLLIFQLILNLGEEKGLFIEAHSLIVKIPISLAELPDQMDYIPEYGTTSRSPLLSYNFKSK